MKKILITSFILFSYTNCMTQTIGNTRKDSLEYYKNEDLISQKITEILANSQYVTLPDSTTTILSNYNRINNISIKLKQKQESLIKMLYNIYLSRDEKILLFKRMEILAKNPNSLIPLTLVTEMKGKL